MKGFSLKDKLRNILKPKRDIVMTPGTDVPYPPRISRTNTDDVTGKETVKKRTENIAKSLKSEHPKIGPDLVSLVTSHSTYGEYQHDVHYKNPVFGPGRKFLFWKYPHLHDVKLEQNIMMLGNDDERLEEKNVELFKEFTTRCLRATYLPGNLEERSEKSGIVPSKLREAYEGDGIISKIDWKQEASNAVIIKVSQKVPETEEAKNVKHEPSFQVIEDQVNGVNLFDNAKTLSELIAERGIKVDAKASEEEKTALVLDELSKNYGDKVTVILLRDETDKGWYAEKVAGKLGMKNVYPIFDYEAVNKVKEIYYESPASELRKTIRKYAIGAAVLIGALGVSFVAGTYSGPEQPVEKVAVEVPAAVKPAVKSPTKSAKKAPAKAKKKSAKKSSSKKKAVSSKPYAVIKPVYDSKKGRVTITVDVSDPDGIEKIVATSKSNIGMDEDIFNITYGVRACALCKKKDIKTEQSETYKKKAGSGYWLRGGTYKMRFEFTDTKGNKSVYNKTLKIPHK